LGNERLTALSNIGISDFMKTNDEAPGGKERREKQRSDNCEDVSGISTRGHGMRKKVE
jgi:hypothetical protein